MSTASDNKVLSFLSFYFQKGANFVKGAVAARSDGQNINNYSDADMEKLRLEYNKTAEASQQISKADLAKDLQYFKGANKNDGVTLTGSTFGNSDKVTQWDLYEAFQHQQTIESMKKQEA